MKAETAFLSITESMSSTDSEGWIPIEPIDGKVCRIVAVIGPTGSGKSTIINMLHNDGYLKSDCEEPCQVGASADSVTKATNWIIKGRAVYVDTVGFGDPSLSDMEIAGSLKDFMIRHDSGVHSIIIVAKFGRVSRTDRANLHLLDAVFDKDWMKGAILVLTHYDGETDNESKRSAIAEWCGNDQFVQNFVANLDGRVVLTNNSTRSVRNEEFTRPLRKHCLIALKKHIYSRSELIRRAPDNWVTSLKYLLEAIFKLYGTQKAAERTGNIIDYLQKRALLAEECALCLQSINIHETVITECGHSFHVPCLRDAAPFSGFPCPKCTHPLHKIFKAMLVNDMLTLQR